jgi:3-oxoacyl-[acyl-carrier protein] reductase
MGLFENKVVVITGAGSGFGREAALLFAKEGASVAICGRRLSKIQAVEETIRSNYHDRVLGLSVDVSDEESVQTFVKSIVEAFGRVDIVINNAAVFQQYDVAESSLESWEYHLENNTTSVFLMMRETIPYMRVQKSGRLISITSGLAREGGAGFSGYTASKAAVEALTYSVHDEEYKNGISAHVFNPGVMKSELQSLGEDPANVAPYLVQFIASSHLYTDKKVYQLEDVDLVKS